MLSFSVRRRLLTASSLRVRAGATCALLLAASAAAGVAAAGPANAADAAVAKPTATATATATATQTAAPSPAAATPDADPKPPVEVAPAVVEPVVSPEPVVSAEPVVTAKPAVAPKPVVTAKPSVAPKPSAKPAAKPATTKGGPAVVMAPATAPVITTQPKTQTVDVGKNVTFTAHATGLPTPTVQWQTNNYPGGAFSDIVGATSDSYTITAVATAVSDHEYRAVFTNLGGSVNSAAALLTVNVPPAAGTPSAVRNLHARQTAPGQITITWQAPASEGTSPISSFGAGYGQKYWGNGETYSPGTFRAVFDHIDDGDYQAVAFASNDSGVGQRVFVQVSVGDLPSAPQDVTATRTGAHQVTVTWKAPAKQGYSAVTGYNVGYTSSAHSKSKTVSAATRKLVFDGVPAGTYKIAVAASNKVGSGSPATRSVSIPAQTPPSAPRHVRVTQTGPHQITLTWKAPARAGSSKVTGYDAGYATEAYGNGGSVSPTTFRAVFDDLPRGEYTASVAAFNESGSGSRVFVPVTVGAFTKATTEPTQAAAAAPASTTDELALTGAPVYSQLGLAFGLLVMGGALTVAGRRRRDGEAAA